MGPRCFYFKQACSSPILSLDTKNVFRSLWNYNTPFSFVLLDYNSGSCDCVCHKMWTKTLQFQKMHAMYSTIFPLNLLLITSLRLHINLFVSCHCFSQKYKIGLVEEKVNFIKKILTSEESAAHSAARAKWCFPGIPSGRNLMLQTDTVSRDYAWN